MSTDEVPDVHEQRAHATELLCDARDGNRAAADELLELAYRELHALAKRMMAREQPGATLQPTALVHEAYMRLVRADRIDWKGRTHFRALSSLAMSRILKERGRSRVRRPGRVEIDTAVAADGVPVDPVEVAEAIDALGSRHERMATVVRYRFFGGLSQQEIAHLLGVTTRTVREDWRLGKAWLHRFLAEKD